MLAEIREKIAKAVDANHLWGYRPQGVPQVEPSILALLALQTDADRYHSLIDQGLQTLASWQDADGAFRIREGNPQSVWPTALALYLLARLSPDSPTIPRAVAWLSGLQGITLPDDEEYRRDFDINPSLPGWPWVQNTFSWVQPTAWVCLALRQAGYGDHPRLKQGMEMLLDRAYDEGGINYGNRRVFGRATEPVPADTALFLLAMQGTPDHPRLQAARQFMIQVARDNPDLENLCWARLSLDVWREDPAAANVLDMLDEHIPGAYQAREACELFAPSLPREALTVLALSCRAAHPLALPSSTQQLEPPPPIRGKRPSWGERLASSMRGMMISAVGRLRSVTTPAMVHVAAARDYEDDLASLLWSQYAAFRTQVPLHNKRVVLKPNMVEYHPDKVINTHPRVVEAVIELCQREGAKEVIVAEGPGHWRNVEYIVTASGLAEVLKRKGVRFVDLNHDNPVAVPNLGRCTRMEMLYLSETVFRADVVISLPKLKTHHWAGVTLSLKNLFGTLPGICYGWPKNALHWQGIENSIVDIALTRTPELAIVDGIIGMDGDGPLMGDAKSMGVLVMGTDLLAVDATCCRLMCLDPYKVEHLALGYARKLGILPEKDIVQIGRPIQELAKPFEPHPRFAHLKLAPLSASS